MVTTLSGLKTIAVRVIVTSDCGCSCMDVAMAAMRKRELRLAVCEFTCVCSTHSMAARGLLIRPSFTEREAWSLRRNARASVLYATLSIVVFHSVARVAQPQAQATKGSHVQGQGCGGDRRGHGCVNTAPVEAIFKQLVPTASSLKCTHVVHRYRRRNGKAADQRGRKRGYC